jgi:branched-chain amino acid transport system ATP-binding protein
MLLDEPTAGMGIEDVDRTIELVRRIAVGRTVVFVDHNMRVVGSLADRVTVLQQGRCWPRAATTRSATTNG